MASESYVTRVVLAGGYPGGVWTCAGCTAQLAGEGFTHDEGCTVIAAILGRAADLIVRVESLRRGLADVMEVMGRPVAAIDGMSDVRLRDVVCTAVEELAEAAAAERERIAKLAEQHGAVCAGLADESAVTTGVTTVWVDGQPPVHMVPFADLIRKPPS
jgi:hypothetical protein